LKLRQPFGGFGVLGVHEADAVTLLLQEASNGAGVIDVAGNHEAARPRVGLTDPFQLLPGSEQQLQGDAAGVGEPNRPAQVAGTPTFSLLS